MSTYEEHVREAYRHLEAMEEHAKKQERAETDEQRKMLWEYRRANASSALAWLKTMPGIHFILRD